MGYASALAWVLFIVILIITVIQLRLSQRFVYYEGE
jgi:multiple sugar transport system permease protein